MIKTTGIAIVETTKIFSKGFEAITAFVEGKKRFYSLAHKNKRCRFEILAPKIF